MMTKLKSSGAALLLIASMGLILSSCTEDNLDDNNNAGSEDAKVQFNLTDAPALYDKVLIEIEEVRVHIGDENDPNDTTAGWYTLDSIQSGIYDLLELSNGIDTVLASGDVPPGKLSQVRLILGNNNSVVIGGVSSPLKTPSAQQSGLKLLVNYELEAGLYYEFWLDFDASQSIVATGNGKFILKPVIKVFTKNNTGSIEGYINPPAAQPSILAYDATDSAMTVADSTSGYYLIPGLDPSSYTVEYDAQASFKDTTLTGVSVTQGNVTDLDTLNL